MKKRTYIYKNFERFWHWAQALLIIFLMITGFEVHGSFSLMGYEEAVLFHDIAAWAFTVLILFTIFWHFATGSCEHYIPSNKFVKEQINYYIIGIFKGAHHPTKKTSYNKFNPLQRLTYFGFKILIIPVQFVTGFIYMYYMYPENPIDIKSLEIIALIHTFGAFLLIVFIIAHVYLLTTNEEPKESFMAMVTGWEELDIDPEEEHKQHMQYAVDKSTAGYYRLNNEGKFIDVNRAWLDLYKCKDKSNIIGKHFSTTRKKEDLKSLENLISDVLKGKSFKAIPSVRKCFDGKFAKHVLSINPTYENNEIIGCEGFIIDNPEI